MNLFSGSQWWINIVLELSNDLLNNYRRWYFWLLRMQRVEEVKSFPIVGVFKFSIIAHSQKYSVSSNIWCVLSHYDILIHFSKQGKQKTICNTFFPSLPLHKFYEQLILTVSPKTKKWNGPFFVIRVWQRSIQSNKEVRNRNLASNYD